MSIQCFIVVKSISKTKIWLFPLRNFSFLYIRKENGVTSPNYPFFSLSIICQVNSYGRLNTKENFKLLALEVVAVDYERLFLTRGSKYSDLT